MARKRMKLMGEGGLTLKKRPAAPSGGSSGKKEYEDLSGEIPEIDSILKKKKKAKQNAKKILRRKERVWVEGSCCNPGRWEYR